MSSFGSRHTGWAKAGAFTISASMRKWATKVAGVCVVRARMAANLGRVSTVENSSSNAGLITS